MNASETMPETKRLYFDDAYRTEFTAEVVERLVYDGQPAVVLDQTCFYPESGGQPSDRGMIGGVEVLRVLDEGGKIFHVLRREVAGPRITAKIDWTLRFDHMQQHSGQHILSQAFYEILHGETLSFHLGEETAMIEIGISKVADEDVERVERRANEIVFGDRAIKTYFVPGEKLGEIPLRKPPKKEGLIRIVEVDGFDYSACGGTHCRRAGEIGLIKAPRWERIRNNLRFDFLCGWRALADYSLKNGVVRQLSGRFSVKEADVPVSVGKLSDEFKTAKKQLRKGEEKLAFFEAQDFIKRAAGKIIVEVFGDRTPEGAKYLALNIIRQGEFAVLFGVKTELRSHLILASSDSLKLDLRPLVSVVSPAFNGRGGGGPSLVEIAGDPSADLAPIMDRAVEFVRERLGSYS